MRQTISHDNKQHLSTEEEEAVHPNLTKSHISPRKREKERERERKRESNSADALPYSSYSIVVQLPSAKAIPKYHIPSGIGKVGEREKKEEKES